MIPIMIAQHRGDDTASHSGGDTRNKYVVYSVCRFFFSS